MDIKVNSCGNCPFLVIDIDYDAVGFDTIEKCNLANFFRISDSIIDVYNTHERDLHCDYCNNWDSFDEEYDKTICTCQELWDSIKAEDNTPKWCPLRKNSNINVIQNK